VELASGWRKLASGTPVYFKDGVRIPTTGGCSWLVERPSGNPEPDFPEDCYVIEECGAPSIEFESGGFTCAAGHAMGSLEEELGPFGNEWQREQDER
jgi:hypothetical protein